MLRKNIKIILKNTTLARNVGSAARAMKTMGITDLSLVQKKCEIDPLCLAVATSGSSIIESRTEYADLPSALADCNIVFATSSRSRTIKWPTMTLREASSYISKLADDHKVGIIFGGESSGLDNTDLRSSDYQLVIPADPIYPVLNLAQAVQLVCYELYISLCEQSKEDVEFQQEEFANHHGKNILSDRLKQLLARIEEIDPSAKVSILPKLERVFTKANLTTSELNILLGLFKFILEQIK